MSSLNKVLIVVVGLFFLSITLVNWDTFVSLSETLLYVIFAAAGVAIIILVGVYGHAAFDHIFHLRINRKNASEDHLQKRAETTNLTLGNQAKQIELDRYEEVITQALSTEGVYPKRFLGTQFGTQSIASSSQVPMLGSGEVVSGLPERIEYDHYVNGPDQSINKLFGGITYDNEPLFFELPKMIHVLIVGSSGGGKSVFIANLLAQLINAKEDVEFDLVDPVGNTFTNFHLPFLREKREVEQLMLGYKDEFERRLGLYEVLGGDFDAEAITSLDQYNRIANEPLPYKVLFIEEGLSLIRKSPIIEETIRDLVSGARKVGMIVVFVAQSAKSTVLDTEVRSNFLTRVMFPIKERSLARIAIEDFDQRVLGSTKGRCAISYLEKTYVVQTPWVDPQVMIAAGYVARDQNMVTSSPNVITIDQEAEILDLSQFYTNDDGLPIISKDHGTAKERMIKFFEVCDEKGIDYESIDDALILKSVNASVAGYNYNVLRQIKQEM